MSMVISRRVNRQRRVGLPTSLAKQSGIEPERWVTVRPAKGRKWALLVKPVEAPEAAQRVRDPDRPRLVTTVMQVTVPKPWMIQVGLNPEDWVFLSSLGKGKGLQMVPQTKTRLSETDE